MGFEQIINYYLLGLLEVSDVAQVVCAICDYQGAKKLN
jgi:hypothetical protein